MSIPTRADFPLTLEEVHEAMRNERKAFAATFLYWLFRESTLDRNRIIDAVTELAEVEELWWK